MELQFGKNIWSTSNLSVVSFKNGDEIGIAKSQNEWKKLCDEKKPACAFLQFKDKLTKDGVFYNRFAITDSRGLLPEGWFLPDVKHWEKLARAIGGKKNAGEAMKAPKVWNNYKSSSPGNSKFAAIPSGRIDTNKKSPFFSLVGSISNWWAIDNASGDLLSISVSEYSTELLFQPIIRDNMNNPDYCGLNIRCAKDL